MNNVQALFPLFLNTADTEKEQHTTEKKKKRQSGQKNFFGNCHTIPLI
jgi:hypothetical protein